MKKSNLLKNVIKGCMKQYDIEEITIIRGYKPLFSGTYQAFFSECDITMFRYREELLKSEVVEKTVLNNRKLFAFLKESED